MSNDTKYLDLIKTADPDLYLIKTALMQTGINPAILPRIIRSMANMTYGTKYGKIQIFMQDGIITQVKGEEWDQLNLEATVKVV